MQTERMQEAFKKIHAHQHTKCNGPKNWPKYQGSHNYHGKVFSAEHLRSKR